MMSTRFIVGILGASVSLMGPHVALAQSVPSAGDQLQEIVVTAERRNESLVNVPISVTALSADTLERSGVDSMSDLGSVVPGLHIDQTGVFFQPTIRGVGTAISSAGISSNVATYLDGVYQPDQLFGNFEFIDVDSVQVLKGPQGTLFGRNATGGAILVSTRSPSFTPELDVRASYGSFNTVNYSAFGSNALIDGKLAMSVAIGGSHSDGWLKNTVTDTDANPSSDWTGRVKFLFTPSDQMNVTLNLHASQIDDPTAWVGSVYNGWSDATLFGIPVTVGSNRRVSLAPGSYYNYQKGGGTDLKVEYDLGFAKFTSLTAYYAIKQEEVTTESYAPFVPDGTPPLPTSGIVSFANYAGIPGYDHGFSQEFDLASTSSGPLDWVTGLYYFWDKQTTSPLYVSLYGPFGPGGVLTGGSYPFPAASYANVSTDISSYAGIAYTIAVFGDATYNWGNWHFTGGLRLTEDDAGADYQAPSTLGSGFVAVPYTTLSHKFYSATPRAVVRYSLTDNSNVYASFSQGNKAGAYNTSSIPSQPNPVDPEKLNASEVGYKVSARDWRFESAAFYYDYKDLQVATYKTTGTFLQSAQKAEIFGGETHLNGRLFSNLTLDIGAAYTHARYIDFPVATVQTWSPVLGVENVNVNVAGKTMERSPAFSGSTSLNYSIPTSIGKFDVSPTYSYQSYVYFDFADTIKQGGYGLLALRAGWTDMSGHWSVDVIGRNVTNAKYLTQVLPRASGAYGEGFGEPANVALELRYKL